MHLKIVSWNIRGANDGAKRKIVKALVRSQRADVVCVQETKLSSMLDSLFRSLGACRFLNWEALDAAGGVLFFGMKEVFHNRKVLVGDFTCLADSRMSKMALAGRLQGSMNCYTDTVGSCFGKNWGLSEACGVIPGVVGKTF